MHVAKKIAVLKDQNHGPKWPVLKKIKIKKQAELKASLIWHGLVAFMTQIHISRKASRLG